MGPQTQHRPTSTIIQHTAQPLFRILGPSPVLDALARLGAPPPSPRHSNPPLRTPRRGSPRKAPRCLPQLPYCAPQCRDSGSQSRHAASGCCWALRRQQAVPPGAGGPELAAADTSPSRWPGVCFWRVEKSMPRRISVVNGSPSRWMLRTAEHDDDSVAWREAVVQRDCLLLECHILR